MYDKQNLRLYVILTITLTIFFYIFRILPHPPNFTPVIAITMYSAIYFGKRSLPFIVLSYGITDAFLGFHNLLIFTWGSLACIGIMSKYYKSFFKRIIGCFVSPVIFYIFTNFGVWALGNMYIHDLNGLINCYILAIPFFTNTLLSTLIFSLLIELFFLYKKKSLKLVIK